MRIVIALGGNALLRRSDPMTTEVQRRNVRTGVVLVTFVFTTLIHEPASIVTLLGVFLLSIGLDLGWKRTRAGRAKPVAAGR